MFGWAYNREHIFNQKHANIVYAELLMLFVQIFWNQKHRLTVQVELTAEDDVKTDHDLIEWLAHANHNNAIKSTLENWVSIVLY